MGLAIGPSVGAAGISGVEPDCSVGEAAGGLSSHGAGVGVGRWELFNFGVASSEPGVGNRVLSGSAVAGSEPGVGIRVLYDSGAASTELGVGFRGMVGAGVVSWSDWPRATGGPSDGPPGP